MSDRAVSTLSYMVLALCCVGFFWVAIGIVIDAAPIAESLQMQEIRQNLQIANDTHGSN